MQDKEKINDHILRWFPLLDQPLASVMYYNMCPDPGDDSYMLTGSVAEGLTVGNIIPDVDMVVQHVPSLNKATDEGYWVNLSKVLTLSPEEYVDAVVDKPNKPGYAWLHIQNETVQKYFKQTFGDDVLYEIEDNYYLNPSKIWKSHQASGHHDKIVSVECDKVSESDTGPSCTLMSLITPLTQRMEQEGEVVCALNVPHWPKVADLWTSRNREWPSNQVVQEVMKCGYYLVPKHSPGGNADLEWRLSFSQAEIILSNNMTNVQKNCYKFINAIHNKELQNPKVLTTYHMKTVFLWILETFPDSQWTEETTADRVCDILYEVLIFLTEGKLPHYFLPELNLLDGFSHDEIDSVTKKLTSIIHNLDQYPQQSPVDFVISGLGGHIQIAKQETLAFQNLTHRARAQTLQLIIHQLFICMVSGNASQLNMDKFQLTSTDKKSVVWANRILMLFSLGALIRDIDPKKYFCMNMGGITQHFQYLISMYQKDKNATVNTFEQSGMVKCADTFDFLINIFN